MPGFCKAGHNKEMHAELQWALFGILITHVHMESIKNVAGQILYLCFFSLNENNECLTISKNGQPKCHNKTTHVFL